MELLSFLPLIKDSFESWYNENVSKVPVSIIITYSDEQQLSIKAIHTATIVVAAVKIQDNTSYTEGLFKLSENYNHGTTSEDQAKEMMFKKLLKKLYSYK